MSKFDDARSNLIDVLRKSGMLEVDKDGNPIQHGEDIYADYRDRIGPEDALKILEADSPEDALNDWMDNVYSDYICENKWGLVEDAMEGIYPKDEEEAHEIEYFLYDELYEMLVYNLPYDHYLDQEFCADLMIDTGDSNFDYGCNSPYPHYYGEKGEGIEGVSSLVWLAKTQGYTKKELEAALDEGDVAAPEGFLESVRQEVANETSGMNCLTFLAKMTLRDLIKVNKFIKLQEPDGKKIFHAELRPDCGTLKIRKNAAPGLYDPWNGAGSVFEIQLEKEITLPIKYIRSCLPDEHFRWSVKNVYSMCDSAWEDIVYDIRGPQEH